MALPVSRKKRIAGIAIIGVLLASGAGAAYAFWTAGGSGTGTATTGTNTAFTVSAADPVGAPLYPGGPSQSVTFTVTNPAAGRQMLSAVAVTVAGAAGAAWNGVPGCSSADYTVGTPAFTPGEVDGGASATGTVTISMVDAATNQDGCKLASVPLYILAS